MAAVQQKATLEDRLCNDDYKNWQIGGLCLFLVKEGLESFVTQESHGLHQMLLALSTPCGHCTQDDLKKKKLCSNCEKFKVEIRKCMMKNENNNEENTNKAKIKKGNWEIKDENSKTPNWQNTDVKNWLQKHWSVARCFMNYQKYQHDSAADADISALLNFIIFCNVFRDTGTYGKIQDDAKKVREHRNKIFHNKNGTLEKKDLDDGMKDMIQLLENRNGKLANNEKAKEAIKEIKKALNGEITLTLKTQNMNKLVFAEAQMDDLKSLHDKYVEEFRRLQTNCIFQGQKVEILMLLIQATTVKLQGRLDIIRTDQTRTDEELSTIISDMIHTLKSSWNRISSLEEMLGKMEINLDTLMKCFETKQKQNSKTKTTDLSKMQKSMIQSYESQLLISLNPVFLSRKAQKALGDVYTNIILEKESEETQKAARENKEEDQIKSFRQLFWNEKANVPIYRIVLKGKAGLGKTTFLKFVLKTWCIWHANRLKNVKGGLPTWNESSDDLKDGDEMEKFQVLLYVNLGWISDEKDIIEGIYKQIPSLDTNVLPRENLHDLMSEPCGNTVLMLMDGFDEMNINVSSTAYIEQIIKGLKYPHMTVIVASRPWNIDKLYHIDLANSMHLHINMKGFSSENSKLFAEKILNYYQADIKQFWDDVIQNDNAKSLIRIPIFALFLVQVWCKNKRFPQTVYQLYLKMLEILVKRYDMNTRKDAIINYPVEKLEMFPKLQNTAITKIIGEENLLAICNIAYQFLIDGKQESPRQYAEVLDHLGNDGDKKWQLALDIGLVSPDDCTGGVDENRNVRVSFPHKTIQELLAAISLCCNPDNFTHFLDSLKTYSDVVQNETIITFIAGISSQICEKIFEKIYETCDDQPVYENMGIMAADLYTLFMKCVKEAEMSTQFRLKHVYIESSEKLNIIVPSIKNIKDIRSLFLQYVDFTSNTDKECFNIFECDNLECLKLTQIELDDIDLKWLLSPGLFSLELSCVHMSRRSSELLCGTLSQCKKLTNLEVEFVELGGGKMDLQDHSCLSQLRLRHVTISSLNLSKCTNLKKLTLLSTSLGDSKLDLNDCSFLSDLSLTCLGSISILNLSKCTNLKRLDLSNVYDDNLDLLGASSLSQLSLSSVTLHSLNLSECINLEKLVIVWKVKAGDGKLDLKYCSCLSELQLEYVKITILNLSKCKQIKRLTLSDIKLVDHNLDLQYCSCLSELWLASVTISSLNLSKCTNLQELTLKDVKLVDHNLDLQDCSCLSQLKLENITISSLNLSKCANLKELELKDVKLSDDKLDLQDCSCLSQLKLENITISSLNLSKCTNLNLLTLSYVIVGDYKLDLLDASCLSFLELSEVAISSLNLSKCTNLKILALSSVKVGDNKLDLLGASCLSFLVLSKVDISSLNLSKCTNLDKLRLEAVKIGDDKLDLQDCSCLSELWLASVTISSLNLSKCINLQKLTLKDVKIGDDKLDLQDCSCLSKLWLASVTISSLNLSKCTNLKLLAEPYANKYADQLDLEHYFYLSQFINHKKPALKVVKLGDDTMDLQDHSSLSTLKLEEVNISSLNLSKCANLIRLELTDVKLGDGKLDLPDGYFYNHLSKSTNLDKQTLKTVRLHDGKLSLFWIRPGSQNDI